MPQPSSAAQTDAARLAPVGGPFCRALRLTGDATLNPASGESHPLAEGDPIDGSALLTLAAGAELTVQAAPSTRELTLFGPAVVEVCPGGEEEVRMSFGRVAGFPGNGVRPGSDVWICTPLGTIRFNDARIDIAVADPSADRIDIGVHGGRASFSAAPSTRVLRTDGGVASELPIAAGDTLRAEREGKPVLALVSELVSRCKKDSEAAGAAARKLLEPPPREPADMGQRALAHVRARQRARASCGEAHAAASLLPSSRLAPLAVELAAAEATWKSLPGSLSLTPLPARR